MFGQKIQKKINRISDHHYTRDLLKKINSVDVERSAYLFVFNQVESNYNFKLYALLSYELSKLGIASFFLYHDDLLGSFDPRFSINGHAISNSLLVENRGAVKPRSKKQGLFFDWRIDIENQKIETRGINFFATIQNTLRKIQKRYNVFFRDENDSPVFSDLIESCDVLLNYFMLFKAYSKATGKKIRLVGFEKDYIPNGVLKVLCDRMSNNGDIEFIELRRGYVYYFQKDALRESHHFRTSYVTCANLTKTGLMYSFAVSKDEMLQFNEDGIDFDELSAPISSAIEKKIYAKAPENQKDVIAKIQHYRRQGCNVFVLFSHLFYDTPVDDVSPAFNGMCAWIKDTIQYFNNSQDLLLIKPHPAEFIKDDPKKAPTETLKSFLKEISLSDNIIMLDPHQFTIKDLSPLTTCGLIWRSSVAMELTFLGVPCIIAGHPVYNALNLYYAESKEHYFQMIKHAQDLKVSEAQKKDVAKYLYLLMRKHIEVEGISYDKNYRKFYWNKKELLRFLKKGSDNIHSIVNLLLQ
jgi:hypothetical protein